MTWLRPALPAATLALCVAACAPGESGADETTDRATAAVATPTRVFMVPTGGHARTLCRAEINRYYCDAASAQDAALDCLAALPDGDFEDECSSDGEGCLRYEARAEACSGAAQIYPTLASCAAPVRDNCAFYSACLERNVPCGEDGYALGYGERYCTAFKNASFSSKGRAWMTSTMLCLQKALVPYTTPAHASERCDDVMQVAFDSHPACYTQPSASICFLSPWDALSVLQTIGAQELFAARTLKQIKTVIGTCLLQIGRQVLLAGASTGASLPTYALPHHVGAADEPVVVPEGLDLAEHYAFWQDLDRRYAEP